MRPGAPRSNDPSPRERSASPGVVGRTKVLALGRDRRGVPRTPPLTDRGKWQLAWDKQSRIRAGSDEGVVRMTAHTYPRDRSYGLALGNRLLAELRKGDLVVATGSDGHRLCYRVTRVLRVRATQLRPGVLHLRPASPASPSSSAPANAADPGTGRHRTIWFADPLTQG